MPPLTETKAPGAQFDVLIKSIELTGVMTATITAESMGKSVVFTVSRNDAHKLRIDQWIKINATWEERDGYV